VADLTPVFIEPSSQNQPIMSTDFTISFYENQAGRVFDIHAVSRNQQPLANITYEMLPISKTNQRPEDESSLKWLSSFEIKSETGNDSTTRWFLNCNNPFTLADNEELDIPFVIRAYESEALYSDKRILIRVINGDLCKPVFDKELYEFSVVENIKEILEPMEVSDCDNGINGRIILSTTNPEFQFKFTEVYKHARLGLEMKKSYNYEDLVEKTGSNSIEFDIIATSSNDSINK
jgi:hypothetical protein